jgi:hypothetical protein
MTPAGLNNAPDGLIRIAAISFVIILFCSSMSAQSGLQTRVSERNYNEDLYIQTDRDVYIAGEEVYLKISEFGGLTHNAGGISKVVYVDMLDHFNTPVIQMKIETDSRTGEGVFRIPDTLRTGCYFIRSFTNWMKNFPQSYFAYRKISVINPFENLSRLKIPPVDNQPDSVIFYPETGYLVSGIGTRLGVCCYNENGEPVTANGKIIDSEGHVLDQFMTDRHGTGLVSIKPSSSDNLFLVTSDSTGQGRRFALPSVRETGMTFNVIADKQADNVIISLLKSPGFNVPGGIIDITWSHASFPPVIKTVSTESDSAINFSQDILPAGLAKITVTDKAGLLLASRWFYNVKKPGISYRVTVRSEDFSPRGKMKFDIKAEDERGQSVESNLSVSVIRPVLMGNSNSSNLLRRIQSPEIQELNTDLVLPDMNDYLIFYRDESDLTGYADSDTAIHYLPEPEGHIISGVIRDKSTDAPLSNEDISISFVGKTARCNFTRASVNGEFLTAVKEYGVKEIVVQPLSPETDGYYVDLIDPFLPDPRGFQPGPLYIDTTSLEEINKAIVSMQVKNIYNPFLQPGISGSKGNGGPDFYGEPDKIILLSEFIELTTIREVLKEIVPGVSAVNRNEKSSLRLINKYPDASFTTPPLVIVDGIPIYDINKVLEIRSSDIERIEVLNTRYFVYDIIIEGIINIVSKKGDLSVLEFDRSVFRQEFDGLHDGHKFNFPNYSIDALKSSRLPDFRNTLYWNPDVRTDRDGNAAIEFYTSDETGEYTVIVEGFTSDGKRGREVTSFTVRNN